MSLLDLLLQIKITVSIGFSFLLIIDPQTHFTVLSDASEHLHSREPCECMQYIINSIKGGGRFKARLLVHTSFWFDTLVPVI